MQYIKINLSVTITNTKKLVYFKFLVNIEYTAVIEYTQLFSHTRKITSTYSTLILNLLKKIKVLM